MIMRSAPIPMKLRAPGAIGLLLAATLAAAHPAVANDASAKKMVTVSGQQVEELLPGILQGYLAEDERIDSKRFVPPAPAEGSARQKLDEAWAEEMLKLRGSPRWDVATRDAAYFPGAANTFSCALGIRISEETTPALYLLLWRSLTDIGLATYTAKNAYGRARPFMTNDTPVCTPEIADEMRKDGSYPSGHTAYGWGWALILTELAPDRAEEILARGRAYGESRSVCNVHWYSDVVAGRMVGAGAVAKLHANADFVAAMAAARKEIVAARQKGETPAKDCALEASVLAPSP